MIKPKALKQSPANSSATDSPAPHVARCKALVRPTPRPVEHVVVTKPEKQCLEEMTRLACRTRVPLDDREMHWFRKDMRARATCTMPGIMGEPCAADGNGDALVPLSTVADYLGELKQLIAQREVTWAAGAAADYHHKALIARLKSQVSHLRVVCAKRQAEKAGLNCALAEQAQELSRLRSAVQRLQSALLLQHKGGPVEPEPDPTHAHSTAPGPRRNPGPAALMANALHRARCAATTAGSLLN